MKAMFGLFAVLLLAGCATTWVDPHLNIRHSQVRVDCPDDPLGLGPSIKVFLNQAGVDTKPSDSKSAGDLVLKVTYRHKRSNDGVSTIQAVQAQMLDDRYHSVEARYQWEGQGDSTNDVAQRLVDALIGQ